MDVSKTFSKSQITFSPPVSKQRRRKVLDIIIDARWRKQMKKLVDFGCSSFEFFMSIKVLSNLCEIVLVDISEHVLEKNISHVLPDYPHKFLKRREGPLMVNIFVGSVIYPDKRLVDTDVVTAIELIEHLYPDELEAFPYNVFGFIAPKLVIVTTPNADFNIVFFDDPLKMRNRDHKFEWTRGQFEDWSRNITVRYPNYKVYFSGVGEIPEHTQKYGKSTQLALFIRKDLLGETLDEKSVKCRCSKTGYCRSVNPSSKYLRCKCVCKVCQSKISMGVCRYMCLSRYKNKNMFREISKENEHGYYYKCLRSIIHPYDNDDSRSEEEKFIEEFKKQIFEDVNNNKSFWNPEKCRFEIPLARLLMGKGENDGNFISISELEKLLVKYGYPIESVYESQTGQHHPHLIQSECAATVKQLKPMTRKINIVKEKYNVNVQIFNRTVI